MEICRNPNSYTGALYITVRWLRIQNIEHSGREIGFLHLFFKAPKLFCSFGRKRFLWTPSESRILRVWSKIFEVVQLSWILPIIRIGQFPFPYLAGDPNRLCQASTCFCLPKFERVVCRLPCPSIRCSGCILRPGGSWCSRPSMRYYHLRYRLTGCEACWKCCW